MKTLNFETNDGVKILHFEDGAPSRGVPTFSINQWWSYGGFANGSTQGITTTNPSATTTYLTISSSTTYVPGLTSWGKFPTYITGSGGVFDGGTSTSLLTKIDFCYQRYGYTSTSYTPSKRLFVTHNPSYESENNLVVVAYYDIDFTNRSNEKYEGFTEPYVERSSSSNPYYEFEIDTDISVNYNLFPLFMPASSSGKIYDYALDNPFGDTIDLYVRDTSNSRSSSKTSTTLEQGKLVVLGELK